MPDETWYAHPNDLIGGWSVLTVDGPPSTLSHRGDGREVATFTSEVDARRIAALHNAETMDARETRPDLTPTQIVSDALINWVRSGGGTWPNWLRPYGAAQVVLGALSAAGRLLPEGGQTRTEWGFAWPGDFVQECHTEEVARRAAAIRRPPATVYRREVGPWVAVDQEAGGG